MAEPRDAKERERPAGGPGAPRGEAPPPIDPGHGPVLGELEGGRMPLIEHLRELRTRLRNSVIALIGGFAVAFLFKQELFVLLARPLIEVWNKHLELAPHLGDVSFYFNNLIEPFWTYFAISLWGGIFVASPFIFYQLWKFIAPGLYANERRYGIAFVATSVVFFASGAAFCYAFILPVVFDFLLSYASQNLSAISRGLGLDYQLAGATALQPLLSMQEYLSLSRKLLIAFGLAFELPLVIFFLAITGAVTHRELWKFNRWAMVLAFVGSAALTPPDIYSQAFLAGPLIVLYNLSIIVAWIITVRRERREARAAG
jgi:sec-independent protein translocase protein TatC